MKIPLRIFRGLYTNSDAANIESGYFTEYKNIRTRPGFIESIGFNLESVPVYLPEGESIVAEKYVFLNEDRYKNKEIANGDPTGNYVKQKNTPGYDDLSISGEPRFKPENIYLIQTNNDIILHQNKWTSTFQYKVNNGEWSRKLPIYPLYHKKFEEIEDGLLIKFESQLQESNEWKITYEEMSEPYITELVNDFEQNIKKYLITVTYKGGLYTFYLLDENLPFRYVLGTHSSFRILKPKIINENGICLILMKENAYITGKINRTIWRADKFTEEIGGKILERNTWRRTGFYFDSLVPNIITGGIYDYQVITTNDTPETVIIQKPTEKVEPGWYPLDGDLMETRSYRLRDIDKRPISFDSATGLVPFFKSSDVYPMMIIDGGTQHNFATNLYFSGYTIKDLFNFSQELSFYNFSSGIIVKAKSGEKFRLPGHLILFYDDNSLAFKGRIVNRISFNGGISYLSLNVYPLSWFENVTEYKRTYQIKEGIDFKNTLIDIVTTVITDEGNEYIISHDSIDASLINPNLDKNYALKLTFLQGNVNMYPIRRYVGVNVYARTGLNAEEIKKKDFEQFKSFNLVANINPVKSFYLDDITPNGIFLTQTIGKFFESNNFNIIKSFDDYKTVAGISYILNNDNIYFPAIGGGQILNGVYYKQNVIPSVEGNLLVNVGNVLGVFSRQKEQLTFLDVQPVEGSMLFYIKGITGYKVKDENDIIETSDGVFLHLKEGIFLVTENERVLLSQEINDIVRESYSVSNIYYNAFEKELYYITGNKVFIFYFDMRSWAEISIPGLLSGVYVPDPTFRPTVMEPIVDVSDDYEGNLYFLTSKRKYRLKRTEGKAFMKSQLYGADALDLRKRLNYFTYDYEGKIKAEEKEKESEKRKQEIIYRKLRKRIPRKLEEFEIEFEGKIFNIEADIDIFTEK